MASAAAEVLSRSFAGASAKGDACGPRDALDDAIEVVEDVMICDAQDGPAEVLQKTVTMGIVVAAVRVRVAVELDDEARLGAG